MDPPENLPPQRLLGTVAECNVVLRQQVGQVAAEIRGLRPSEPYTVGRRDIKGFAEYKAHPTIRLGSDFKARVEASSRHFADGILSSLEKNEIRVHPYEPIRDRVLRGRRSWVPAVLRYTAAQNAVLLECCNMANAEDRELMLQRRWRENFARSVVEGMASAFAQ